MSHTRRHTYRISHISLPKNGGFWNREYKWVSEPIEGFRAAERSLIYLRNSLKNSNPTEIWRAHFFVGPRDIYLLVRVDGRNLAEEGLISF